MQVSNSFALALVSAAAKAIIQEGKQAPWVARNVAEKLGRNPNAGMHNVKGINVRCSKRTADRIAACQHVEVWK